MHRLEKCTGCARHVRVTELACPFCQTLLPASFRAPRARPSVAGRFGRIALIAAGASAVGVATEACGDDDNMNVVAEYGVPPDLHFDAGPADAADDATDAQFLPTPAYGLAAPPIDAGLDAESDAADAADGD